MELQHLGLFEGIGGFSLAAEAVGWKTKAWCEINPFCQQVLKYHFPNAEQLNDITKTDFKKYANKIDIITGGFPCQPYSLAGKRKGNQDERHLWPEMLRAIREVKPRWIVGENVGGLLNWGGGLVFEEVQASLEAEGYQVQTFILPACGVNAPHRRERLWIVAHAEGGGRRECGNSNKTKRAFSGIAAQFISSCANVTYTSSAGWEPRYKQRFENATKDKKRRSGISRTIAKFFSGASNWDKFPTQSPVCGRNDGLSLGLDGITFSKWRNESIKAYGNAIVPQVAIQIFNAINEYEKNTINNNNYPNGI